MIKRQRNYDMDMCAKIILNSMYRKHGVWPLETAQTFVLCRTGNVVIGISKEECAMHVFRYGNILH